MTSTLELFETLLNQHPHAACHAAVVTRTGSAHVTVFLQADWMKLKRVEVNTARVTGCDWYLSDETGLGIKHRVGSEIGTK